MWELRHRVPPGADGLVNRHLTLLQGQTAEQDITSDSAAALSDTEMSPSRVC